MKAVIWTDVLQTFVMLAGSLAALIQPAIAVGGFQNVYMALERGKRLNLFEFVKLFGYLAFFFSVFTCKLVSVI